MDTCTYNIDIDKDVQAMAVRRYRPYLNQRRRGSGGVTSRFLQYNLNGSIYTDDDWGEKSFSQTDALYHHAAI